MSILECIRIVKDFSGLKALNGVSFSIGDKEILGLIGPNGAGKTTLFNVIAGQYKPTSGEVKFKGNRITGIPSPTVCHLGIARTFQEPQPFNGLTVLQNIMLGHLFGKPQKRKMSVQEIINLIGLTSRRDDAIENLTIVDQKKVEIAKALATNPALLMLDEVASGLNPSEQDGMTTLIRKLHNDLDITIIIVEHIMRFVMRIASRIIVLNNGDILSVGNPASIAKDKRVITAYLGEEYLEDSGT